MGWFRGWTPEHTCRSKRRYDTWEDARRAGLLVSQENPRPQDANAPTPYICDLIGPRHYHYGHLRGGGQRRKQ